MQARSALEREGLKADEVIPWEKLRDETVALMYADFVHAVVRRGDATERHFRFIIPRAELIAELERMHDWLNSETAVGSLNGRKTR